MRALVAMCALAAAPGVAIAAACDWAFSEPGERLNQAMRDDGAVVIVSRLREDQLSIALVTADGDVRWRRSVTAHAASTPAVRFGHDRLDIGFREEVPALAQSVSVVVALDPDDGEQRWRRVLPTALPPGILFLPCSSIGCPLLTGSTYDIAPHHVVLDGDGDVVSDRPFDPGAWGALSIASDGAALLYRLTDGPVRYYVMSPAGELGPPLDADMLGVTFPQAPQLLDDRTVVTMGEGTTGNEAGRIVAMRVDAQGVARWRRVIAEANEWPATPLVGGDGRLYISIGRRVAFDEYNTVDEPPHRYIALDENNGETRWERTVGAERDGAHFYEGGGFMVDANRSRLLRIARGSNEPRKVRIQTRSTIDGALVREETYDCGAPQCYVRYAVFAPDGDLHLVGDQRESIEAPPRSQVLRLDSASMDAPPAIRIDQAGLRGAWFAPYTSGQGFLLDYDPASRTLFMPWFTFWGVDAPTWSDALVWFTFQGTAAPGAREAAMGIYVNQGGAFASGATTAKPYGEATLTFRDCDNGSLVYRMNSGETGVISLTRATTRVAACELTDGTILSPSANAPAGGFDARLSGAWSDPAAGGQGLLFNIDPGADIVAAWFTYDPADSPDDDTRQHWFTLQGDLSGAAGGAATMGIYRTIGGALDRRPSTQTVLVGQATVTFTACDRARLQYRFDNTYLFGTRSGEIALTRLGGCES